MLITYKNYKAIINYSPWDECYIGKVIDINDLISFESETEDGLQTAFEEAIKDYEEIK